MENKINIAELLEDCPKGMELYSPLCGKCVFDRLNFGTIICKKQNTQEITFTSKGYYMLPVFDDCECMIFPSKDQRDWSKFQRPFMDGDIVVTKTSNNFIFYSIYKGVENRKVLTHVDYHFDSNRLMFNDNLSSLCFIDEIVEQRFVTEDEKQELFDAIKSHGYKWNPKTKTLEKLVEPIFEVGNKVRNKNNHNVVFTISSIEEDFYVCGGKMAFCFNDQDDWELVPNKFDVSALVPFKSEVLVRHNKDNKWCGSFFSHIDGNLHSHCYKYVTVAGKSYPMCIPYEKNEHLLGTTNDCDEYFKNWE